MSLLVPMLLPPRNMPWYHPRTHFQYTIHVSNVTTWRHRFNHLRKIIDTWAPVSQRASVSNPAHFWQYIYAPQNELPGHAPVVTNGLQRHLSSLCLLCIFALRKRIWPGKVSYVVSSVSVDISLNNSWHLQNHYTAWKRRYPFCFHRTFRHSGTSSLQLHPVPLMQPSPVSWHPSTSSCKMICWATFEAMISVVYTCCPTWTTLTPLKLWLVTRYIMWSRIPLHWGTDSVEGFFQGGKIWLHCFQCCHWITG